MPRRKDAIFAKVSCKVLHGQRMNKLSEVDQLRYLKLWILAVRERTACFPVQEYGLVYLAHELHIGTKSLHNSLNRISQSKHIDYLPDGSVIINDVMELHEKLNWDQVHLKDV